MSNKPLRAPKQLTDLGPHVANYLDNLHRTIQDTTQSGSIVGVPIGTAVRRVTVNNGADNYEVPIPDNFVRALGQSLARADYPDLFAAAAVPDGVDAVTVPHDNTILIRVL